MEPKISRIACKNCASQLAKWCYERYWWFRLVREPLLAGMRILAWWNGIDAKKHGVRNAECYGCIRFMRTELEEKSPTFRFFDALIGKPVSRWRNSLLTKQQLDAAKQHARESMTDSRP